MAWLYIPPTPLASVADTEESTSASASRWAEVVAPSCTAKGKLILPRFWLGKWRKEPWIRRLSGPIYSPCRQNELLEDWMSSQPMSSCTAESPVNPGPAPDSAAAMTTPAGSGPPSGALPAKMAWDGFSWKTCGGVFPANLPDWTWCFATSPTPGGMRSGICFRRRSAGRRIDGNGSSSWPTPRGSEGEKYGPNSRDGAGSPHLSAAAMNWPTVTVGDSSCRPYQRDRGVKGMERPSLYGITTGQVVPVKTSTPGKRPASWSTPRAHDTNGGEDLICKGKPALKMQVKQGRVVKLNPTWVESLMGVPRNWTSPWLPAGQAEFQRWETASCHLLRRLLTLFCMGDREDEHAVNPNAFRRPR